MSASSLLRVVGLLVAWTVAGCNALQPCPDTTAVPTGTFTITQHAPNEDRTLEPPYAEGEGREVTIDRAAGTVTVTYQRAADGAEVVEVWKITKLEP